MKKLFMAFLAATCALSLAACGRDKIISTGNQKIDNAVYNDDSISLAPYTGLKAVKNNYKVSEKALEHHINQSSSMNSCLILSPIRPYRARL